MTPLIAGTYLTANICWFILFSPLTAHLVNFWIGMTIAAGLLAMTAFFAQGNSLQKHWEFKPAHIMIGLGSAIILYGVFFIGHALTSRLLPFAQNQVVQIYDTRIQMSPMTIGLLLFFWIGPAEEIFWRGFLQQRLTGIFGPNKGYVITTMMYAMVHVYALNFMLFMAALICGAFWGYMYKRTGLLWPILLSHAIWDVAIFILFPIH